MKIYLCRKNAEEVKLLSITEDNRYIIETSTGAQKSYSKSSFSHLFKFYRDTDKSQTIPDTDSDDDYEQLCVWPGTLLAGRTPEEFEADMLEAYRIKVRFAEEVYTLPCPEKGEEGGRCDLFFYIHRCCIFRFAVPRLLAGIQWWEDILENGQGYLYPKEILKKYPNTWKKLPDT